MRAVVVHVGFQTLAFPLSSLFFLSHPTRVLSLTHVLSCLFLLPCSFVPQADKLFAGQELVELAVGDNEASQGAPRQPIHSHSL